MVVSIDDLKTARFFNVYQDLKGFTFLSDEELTDRLSRIGPHHFLEEYRYWNVALASEAARTWFYKISATYLFANAVHAPWGELADVPKGSHVLDYGAGVGTDALYLGKHRDCHVSCFDVNLLQTAFMEYRFTQHPYCDVWVSKNVNAAMNAHLSDVIVCRDVLEHIPRYDIVITRLVWALRTGGLLYENTPFQKPDQPEDVHLHETIPLAEIFANNGCEPVRPHVWRKGR